MGRKKYYCDFCNRYFNDDKNTRAKHMNSVGHINAKKEHYKIFRDPETVLQEESIKKPCRKFHFEGFCPFGGSCTYSHYTAEDLDAIQQKLFFEKSNKVEPTVETWLMKYYNELNERKLRSQQLQWSCQLPPELYTRMPFLPPSMVPFRLQTFMDADLEMWGE